MISRRCPAVIFVWLLMAGAQTQQAAGSPDATVRQYCQLDFDGARTSSADWQKVAPLIFWPDEPGWDTVTVVLTYRIKSVYRSGTRATVAVEYQTVGEVAGSEFVQDEKRETVDFHLELNSQEWRVQKGEEVLVPAGKRWRLIEPVIQPHVSLATAIQVKTQSQATSQSELEQLQRTILKLKQIEKSQNH